MATRSLNVIISGDATKLKGAFTQAGDHAEKFGRKTEEASHRASESFKRVHEASKLLLEIGGLTSLAFGLKDVTEEAVKAETEQKKLEATVKTAGLSWKAHGKEIDEWLDKTSRASGFVKSDLTSSLSNLIRVTGSVSKARKLEAEAMDVSRARGTSLASAQQLLARVYAGSFTSLQRLGIPVKAVTTAQDKLRETTKHATADQIAHAKAIDKQATVTKALGLVQDKFGGQSKAFASSTAGSFERAKASLDLFEEGVGKVVLPLMAKAATAIANVAAVVSKKWPEIEHTIAGVVAKVKKAITDWVNKNRADINSVITAAVKFGQAAKTVFETVVLPIIKRTVPAIAKILGDLVDVIRGVVRLISGLLSGNWSKAWSGAKEAVGGAARAIVTAVKALAGDLWTVIKALGPKLVKGIVSGLEGLGKALITGILDGIKAAAKAVPGLAEGALKGIGHAVTSGISKGFGALNPFGDGIGKTASSLTLPNLGSLPAGGLHGARPSMGPFAAIGSRFGLHISAGRDDHSVMTSSGNVSYHSTGEAIDEAGSPAGMMGYFRYLKSHFGGRLAELIYGPGQVGIKDGRPYNFGPALNAQHMDHVHVAFDTGRPGVGDGLGKFEATSYGPPWGGIQGGGVTATGVNLKSNPHMYGVAVDPSVIPLGTKLKIKPNPFNYGGYFTAFDTGGAIKGKRIDFYDWRGRSAQLGWGERPVTVDTGSGSGSGSGKNGIVSVPALPHTMYPIGSTHTVTIKPTGQPTYRAPANPLGDQYVATDFANRQSAVRGRTGPAKGNTIRKGNTPDQQAFLSSLPGAPTELDYLNMALSQAGLTADTGDDKAALKNLADYRFRAYQSALAGGDPRAIGQAADDLKSATDALGSFEDTAKALTDALNGVKASMDANLNFATSLANTSNYQNTKTIADLISGHIVGQGVAGRAYTPGTGVEHVY